MTPSDTPPPLSVAASIAAVQGLGLLGLTVLEAASVDGGRIALGVSTAFFFAAYGVLLLAAALGLVRGGTWARGPVLITQLIQLGVAWNFRTDAPVVLLVVLVVAALAAIAGIVHPASVERLSREEPARHGDG